MKLNANHAATWLFSGLLLGAIPVEAAMNTYTFSGTLDSGVFIGETFLGQFNFNDAALTGLGTEYVNVDTLKLNFHGQTYTQVDAAAATEVTFQDGNFLGLGFTVLSSDPAFSFITGLTDVAEASFAYEPSVGTAGFGSVTYTLVPVPEPETYAMFLAGLGLLGFIVRKCEKQILVLNQLSPQEQR